MSAINAALGQIDLVLVGAEGDLAGPALSPLRLDIDDAGDPVELPGGKLVYPPTIHGTPLHELAATLVDENNPARSRFLRMTGPPRGREECALEDHRVHVMAAAWS